MLFTQITDVDPRTLGFADQAAADLGIASDIAVALQNVAYFTEAAGGPVAAVPEPSTAALSLFGLTAVCWKLVVAAAPAVPDASHAES